MTADLKPYPEYEVSFTRRFYKLLCWHVGRRLLNENLQGGRAAYGKQILVTVSRDLTAEHGRGFSYAEIARLHQATEHAREQAARRLPGSGEQP